MNVKFLNNTSKWQMIFNSAFKGLNFKLGMAEVRQTPSLHEPNLVARLLGCEAV
jgi:hypothetical protein